MCHYLVQNIRDEVYDVLKISKLTEQQATKEMKAKLKSKFINSLICMPNIQWVIFKVEIFAEELRKA